MHTCSLKAEYALSVKYIHFLSTPKGKWLEEVVPTVPPRLFQCSNASGRFNVEEIFDFSQEVGIYVQCSALLTPVQARASCVTRD